MLLDPEDRVLLLRGSDPADPGLGEWWELPGGGLEPGESSEEAALRELWEEAGLRAGTVSGPVWRHHATFEWAGLRFDQDELVHLARGEGGEVRPAGLGHLEALAMQGGAWWAIEELAGLDRIIPPWLPEQLPAVLAAGLPEEPIDLGTLT